MNRRFSAVFLAALIVMSGIVPVISLSGVAAAAGNTSTQPAASLSAVTGYVSYDVPGEVVEYGSERVPSFIVEYSNDSGYDKLAAWADASDARAIREHNPAANTAVVSAPVSAVAHSSVDELKEVIGSQDLSERAYVDAVYVNIQMTVPEPVTPQNNSAVSAGLSTMQDLALTVSGGITGAGLAYNQEIQQTSLDNATEIAGADNVTVDGSGVRVAVIDTGINTANGSLYGSRIAAARNFITDENATAANGWAAVEDGVGHGSWVASAIAANATGEKYDGVAPEATLLIGKALNENGGSLADVREAIRWAGKKNADVISMSLGSKVYSKALAETIRNTVEDTSVKAVIVAAGNSRMTTRWVTTPADVPAKGVITVAATDAEPASTARPAYFSSVGPDLTVHDLGGTASYGARPDVAAPGTSIGAQVAAPDATVSVAYHSGTSMATPLVSGVAALTIDAHPGISTANLRDRLLKSAVPIPHAGVTEVGNGMVDAQNAITGTYPSKSQKEARNAKAQARDAANRALGGHTWWPAKTLAEASRWVPSIPSIGA